MPSSIVTDFLSRYAVSLDRMLRLPIARVNTAEWSTSQARQAQVLLDAEPAPSLYAVSVDGRNVLLRATWGTGATRTIDRVLPPFVATLGGTVTVTAVPAAEGEASAVATIARVYGHCCHSVVRSLAIAGDVLDSPAVQLTAIEASTVTPPGGAPQALAAGATWAVIPGTLLASGRGVLSYAI